MVSQAVKMIGNAIVLVVAWRIAEKIVDTTAEYAAEKLAARAETPKRKTA